MYISAEDGGPLCPPLWRALKTGISLAAFTANVVLDFLWNEEAADDYSTNIVRGDGITLELSHNWD